MVETDVSGQPIGPIFQDQAVQQECREHLRTQLYSEWSVQVTGSQET